MLSILHIKEYLSWGWEFEGENNLVRSPFMGGGVNANSASGLKLEITQN